MQRQALPTTTNTLTISNLWRKTLQKEVILKYEF